MATLHVRNVPDDVYARLREASERSRRSINGEAIEILRRELATRPAEVLSFREWLEWTERLRAKARPAKDEVSVVDLIREDRER